MMVVPAVADIERILRGGQAMMAGIWKSLMLFLLLLLRLSSFMAAIQSKGEYVFGKRQRSRSAKRRRCGGRHEKATHAGKGKSRGWRFESRKTETQRRKKEVGADRDRPR